MKKLLVMGISLALASWQLSAQTFVLTDAEGSVEKGNWQISSDAMKIKDQHFSIEQSVLRGGRQEGSKIITINSQNGLKIVLSPTRGMDLLHVTGKNIRLGWDSPVNEVVNPNTINLESRNGVGWLEGFNEMMVRCGFEWTGHPVVSDGMLYTLHGRAGNTPASKVVVDVSEKAPYQITVRGLLKENSFKKSNLETWTELRYIPGSESFTVHDVLTNKADYARDYQIIYHSNFGTPILEQGARFIAPVKDISPFNDYAKAGLKEWQTYQGPTKDFDEMVFNLTPYADQQGKTLAALVNRAGDKGVSIEFDTHQLPLLTLWKNTDTEKQGYVTGIEPGTSYAYPVTIEREQGRVKQLQPGQSTVFELTYSLLSSADAVQKTEQRVKAIQGENKTTLTEKPIAVE
ncbi:MULTISPECIES: aldose 1-epimerase family protein [unclassified Brenneria]|uniref:aldose 1-epimerase family protein n=1 Tax=unclassified Brenneria TaxID=2634434 RepID=UPI001554B9D9|nr:MULTISPECIES: aldose 1-epimerase family protein [unclassified Brenneria]MBJ7223356.1 aldose 1-epimerase family protein [Brenneria sp. L3-3C-1]MEE3644596.1 aldose 1-epimerase family protein [Brenneria sp. L3_3C_1]MEE3652158.1 aldose 1-epimerase family protein [Brenneria sp. HEZEL_4_2_4]NPD02117.1 aldose 1-epimerase family protein [Brenneria sp. hezel4-2-4]